MELSEKKAINGTTVKVTFNKTVDKSTITVSDFTFTSLDGAAIATADIQGSLSEDGKTYTITTVDGSTAKFAGRYDLALAKGAIKTTGNEEIAKYAETIKAEDKVAPSITSAKSTATSATQATLTVNFDEKISSTGTVSINGKVYTGTISTDQKSFTVAGVAVDTTYNIEVVGATDIAGNIANPLSTSVTATADTVAPTVSISAKESTVTLKFSEKLAATPTVTINGNTLTATPQVDADDDTIYTLDVSELLATTSFVNNAVVSVSGYTDVVGNAGKATTYTTNFTSDTTAPTLVSKELVDGKLVLKFDEPVAGTAGAAVSVTGLNLSFVDDEGVIVPLAAADYTLTAVKGKDLNGNSTYETATGEDKYVVVSIADNNNKFTSSGKLAAGKYTFSWAKGAFQDAATNQVAASSFTLSPTTSTSTSKADVKYTVANGSANNKFIVSFTDSATTPAAVLMDSSALNPANYTLGGQALPTGTTLAFYGDKSQVLVTLPQGSITSNGARVLAIKDVKAASGNTLDTTVAAPTVTLKESVLPVAKSVAVNSATKATVTFSEDLETVASVTASQVVVKVNGVTTPAAKTEIANGKLVLTFAAGTLASTDKVSVTFSSAADLVDANGNQVADATFSN